MHTRQNQGTKEKPVVVHEYNHSMNGVDRADQNSVYYPFIQKTRKWWRKLFFWLLEIGVVNSYIRYATHSHNLHTKPLTHLQYRRQVVEALALQFLQAAPERVRPGRPRKRSITISEGDPERLNGRLHLLEKRVRAQDCVVCSNRDAESRHRSQYFCKTWLSTPTLCPTSITIRDKSIIDSYTNL